VLCRCVFYTWTRRNWSQEIIYHDITHALIMHMSIDDSEYVLPGGRIREGKLLPCVKCVLTWIMNTLACSSESITLPSFSLKLIREGEGESVRFRVDDWGAKCHRGNPLPPLPTLCYPPPCVCPNHTTFIPKAEPSSWFHTPLTWICLRQNASELVTRKSDPDPRFHDLIVEMKKDCRQKQRYRMQ
jgi:hypothetical protein